MARESRYLRRNIGQVSEVPTKRDIFCHPVHEAVRIQRWGEDVVLNSKGEYNRCKIGRLTLGDDHKDGHQLPRVDEEEGDQSPEERSVKEWERYRVDKRRAHERPGTVTSQEEGW